MRDLPELIAKKFVEIDKEIVRKDYKKHQNNWLQLDAEDSASLKSFAELSDNPYIKLSRGLFYFTELKLLAPIRDVK